MADNQTSLREQIQLAIAQQDPHTAFDLLEQVDQLIESLGNTNTPEKKTLLKIKAILSFLASRYTSQKALIDLFEHHIVDIAGAPEEVNQKEVLQYRLLTESFNEDRNELRDALKAAIIRSDQELGNNKIQLGSSEVSPTISNWMKVFTAGVGLDKISSVQLARFFAQNPEFQKLSLQEKVIFKKIIEIFQYLTLRSDSLDGYEDYQVLEGPNNKLVRVGGGEIVDFYTTEDLKEFESLGEKGLLSVGQLVDLQNRFPERFNKFKPKKKPQSVQAIDPALLQESMNTFFEEQKKSYEKTSSKTFVNQDMKKEVERLLDLSTSQLTLSSLKQVIVQLIQDPKTFSRLMSKKAIMDFILMYYPEELGQQNKGVLEQGGFSALAFEVFLRIILQKGYGLSEAEAKWHAFTLIQRFPMAMKEYKTLVTYDLNKNELVWRYE